MKYTFFAAAAIAAMGLMTTGCASFSSKEETKIVNPAIQDTVYTLDLDSLKAGKGIPFLPEKAITMTIQNGRIFGCSGINNYSGIIDINPETKSFKTGTIGVTRMYGKGLLYENLFLDALNSADSYDFTPEHKLVLKKAGDVVAEFTSTGAAANPE